MILIRSFLIWSFIMAAHAHPNDDEISNTGALAAFPPEMLGEIAMQLVDDPQSLMNFSQTCKLARNQSYKARSKAKENHLMIYGNEPHSLSWGEYYKNLSNADFIKPQIEKTILNYASLLSIDSQEKLELKFSELNTFDEIMTAHKNVVEFITVLSTPKIINKEATSPQGQHFIETICDLKFYNKLIFLSAYKQEPEQSNYFELQQISHNVDFCRNFITNFPKTKIILDSKTRERGLSFITTLKQTTKIRRD